MGSTVLVRTIVLIYAWCRLTPCCRSGYCQSPGSNSRMAFHILSELERTLESVTHHSDLVNIHLAHVCCHQCACGQAMWENRRHRRFKNSSVGARLLSLRWSWGEDFLFVALCLADRWPEDTHWTRLCVGPDTQAYLGHLGGRLTGRNMILGNYWKYWPFYRGLVHTWIIHLQRPDLLMGRETWLWNSLLPSCCRVPAWRCSSAWEGD